MPTPLPDGRALLPQSVPSLAAVENAILRTLAYVDVFDYPMTAAEVHRYLTGMPAPAAVVHELLTNERLVPGRLSCREGYFTLPGREEIVATRQRREKIAGQLWPQAVNYGRLIARLPFVLMVAVTGSLAVNNVEQEADIDYLIVTANDRLWVCRAFIILVVRLAARRGVSLCPNYLLSQRALVFHERNLYTARELTQMIPITGQDVYRTMRRQNDWTFYWLPNASHLPALAGIVPPLSRPPRRPIHALAQSTLCTPIGGWLEQWEMRRKMDKFSRQAAGKTGSEMEARFSADWCKGHFGSHASRILSAYEERVRVLEIDA